MMATIFNLLGEPITLGTLLVGALISAAISGASALILRQVGKAGPQPGGGSSGRGFEPDTNNTDPNQRMAIRYGSPADFPGVVVDYVKPSSLNKRLPDAAPERVTVLSLGAGPVDGGEQLLWINGALTADSVDDTSQKVELALTRQTPRRYIFPKQFVIPESVTIFFDGVVKGIYKPAAESINAPTETVVTGETAKARAFYRFNDTSVYVPITSAQVASLKPFKNKIRWGFYLPTPGLVAQDSLKVKILDTDTEYAFPPSSWPKSAPLFNTSKVLNKESGVPAKAIHVGTTNDGSGNSVDYVWIDGGPRTFEATYEVSYRVKPLVDVEKSTDGTTIVTFSEDVDSAVEVTAHYKAGALADNVTVEFRDGSIDQEPLPLDNGIRHTFTAGGELSQGTPRRYSSVGVVDDLEIGIQALAGQFATLNNSGGFREAHRKLAVRIKTSDAPDALGKNLDPTTGWVEVWKAGDNNREFDIDGRQVGAALWTFSMADSLAYVKSKTDVGTGNTLPLAKYDVEVVALDAASTNAATVDGLVFGFATEIRRDQLILPRHSTLTITVTDPEVVGRASAYKVGIMGRRVWVPASDAVFDAETGRPEPGEHRFSRNPVWCACDLITDPDFGGGQFYTWESIRLDEAIPAAAACDATVTNADGTTEVSAELDIVLRDSQALSHAVRDIMAGSGVMPALSGGTWRFVIDEDSEPVMALTDEDYQRDEISMNHASLEAVPNEVQYVYTPELFDFEEVTDSLRLPGSEPDAVISTSVDLRGVRRDTQAVRVASRVLRQLHLQRRTVQLLSSGWRALQLEAGDVITLTSPELKLVDWKCRVQRVDWGSNLAVHLTLGEHDPSVYDDANLAPVSRADALANAPGSRSAFAVQTNNLVSGRVQRTRTVPALEKLEMTLVSGDAVDA